MWDKFGIPAHQWDEVMVDDLEWMIQALEQQRSQDAAETARLRTPRG